MSWAMKRCKFVFQYLISRRKNFSYDIFKMFIWNVEFSDIYDRQIPIRNEAAQHVFLSASLIQIVSSWALLLHTFVAMNRWANGNSQKAFPGVTLLAFVASAWDICYFSGSCSKGLWRPAIQHINSSLCLKLTCLWDGLYILI